MSPTDEDELSLIFIPHFCDAERVFPGDKLSPRQERPHEKICSGEKLSPIFIFYLFYVKRVTPGDTLAASGKTPWKELFGG